MKKRIINLVLAGVVALSFSGCGISGTTSDSEKETVEFTIEEAVTEELTEEKTGTASETDTDINDDSGEKANSVQTETDAKVNNDSLAAMHKDIPYIYSQEHNNYVNDEDGTRLLSSSYDRLVLGEEDEERFPGIKTALDAINKAIINTGELWDESEMIRASKMQKDNNEYFMEYVDHSESSIVRLDDKVLSVKIDSENYQGGAHGSYGSVGYNYNVETGAELNLLDVVSSIDELKSAAQEIFSRDYPMVIESEPDSQRAFDDSFNDTDNLVWTLGPTYMTLYYNPYAIASYAAGMQIINIRYSDYPNLFNKGIGESSGDWILETSGMMEDVNGDGSLEYISFNEKYSDDGELSHPVSITLETGVETLEIENECTEKDFYIIKKGDKHFAYIISLGDNDYHIISMYDITDGKITDLGSVVSNISAGRGYVDYGEGYYVDREALFYNPNFFYEEKTMQLISTYDASRPCRIGDDGTIQPLEEAYTAPDLDIVLTSNMDLELEIVDEHGNVQKQETITSGNRFVPYKSDGENYVDCKLDDGRIVRVPIDASEYPHKVNEKNLEDVFEGTMFAG